jgi:hypothetical protein
MSALSPFLKKLLAKPTTSFGMAQVSFRVGVLDKYLTQKGVSVTRTETVGRVKATAWSVDFGIAPDEQTVHVPLSSLVERLPETEREHWISHADDSRLSQNFLKMQGGHACIDDGGFRAWGEEPLF